MRNKDKIIQDNLDKMSLFFQCNRIGGNAAQQGEQYFIGIYKGTNTKNTYLSSEDRKLEFKFPVFDYTKSSEKSFNSEIKLDNSPSFIFYNNRNKTLREGSQYLMHFKKTIDDYIFTYDGSAGNDYVLSRKGILTVDMKNYRVSQNINVILLKNQKSVQRSHGYITEHNRLLKMIIMV